NSRRQLANTSRPVTLSANPGPPWSSTRIGAWRLRPRMPIHWSTPPIFVTTDSSIPDTGSIAVVTASSWCRCHRQNTRLATVSTVSTPTPKTANFAPRQIRRRMLLSDFRYVRGRRLVAAEIYSYGLFQETRRNERTYEWHRIQETAAGRLTEA